MQPDAVTTLATALALILAISLAGERIVEIVKTLAPGWFAAPDPAAPAPTATEDRWRRLRVQGVAFAACWLATASLTEFEYFGSLLLTPTRDLPVVLVALLSMGGSAFWAQIIGITSALKDLKQAQVTDRAADPAPAAPRVRVPAPLVGAPNEA